MKRLLAIFFLLVLGPSLAKAQVVTIEPEFPTAGDSVSIFFDATKGTSGLANFDGDVYAHTGVITDQSTDDSDWQYVITEWPNNIPKIKTVRVEENLYRLDMGPSIREYYGVPEGETIEKMAFVFRNSDGTMEGKAEGGADIFAEVYQSNFNVKLVRPQQNPVLRQESDMLRIFGIASDPSATMTLKVNNQIITEVNNDTLNYLYDTQSEGSYQLQLIGSTDASSDTISTQLITYTEQVDKDRPSGLEDGITYTDNGTGRLSLFAPHKEFVYLIGDFNDWQIDPQYLMNKDMVNADSTYYWIEISSLTPGREYGFQYLVDGQIRVADPYSKKVLDEHNDPNIPESIYPNIKPYPEGQTQHLVGILQPGKQEYDWQHGNYDRPDKEDLVIYELLMRDFLEEHDYEALTDTLDYLDRLGINAIELMPVMEFEGNDSWGYNTSFLFATDKYYGPAEDLKRFIDEAHSRGIAVILDIVLNHAYGQSPLVRLWNEGAFGRPTPQNPYLNVESPNQVFSFGYDFNHEAAATKYFVDRVTQFWLEEFKIDGYRYDFTKGFTQNPGEGSAYDTDRIRLLKRMADQQWAVDDSSYVILEHLTVNQEEQELSDYGMLLWGNYNYNYNEATMGYPDDSDFSGMLYTQRNWSDPHLLGYMESHDEERLMFKNLQFGNSSDGYDITELNTALNRNKMAASFFFTIPGPKMIWQFGELGYDQSINRCEDGSISDACRLSPKPILWEYYSNEQRKRLYNTFQALIGLRQSHPAFTSEESNVTIDAEGTAKHIIIDHPDMDVSIIGNFGVTSLDIQPNYAQNGDWYEFFSGDTLNINNTDTTMNLEPGEFHIYTTQKFDQPENVFADDSNDPGDGNPDSSGKFKLKQNYPNPFHESTTIPYELPETSDVTVTIYNILGRKVWEQKFGEQPAGTNEVPISGANLSSGVYIYRLETESQSASRKMLFVK